MNINENEKKIISFIIDYEVRSSWWAYLISWKWGQELSAKYFAWKSKRKYNRFKTSKMWEKYYKSIINENNK